MPKLRFGSLIKCQGQLDGKQAGHRMLLLALFTGTTIFCKKLFGLCRASKTPVSAVTFVRRILA